MNYEYSPLLKEPAKMPEIDPQKPVMAPMLRIMLKTQQKLTEAFQAPEGCTLKITEMVSGDGVPFRVWTAEPLPAEGNIPAMMLVHGGAFYLPTAVSCLGLACEYAKRMHMRVYVPDYRLLPADPAPKAFEDCLACWKTICEKQEGEDLLIMGESAGGAIAAGLCTWLRDHNGKMPRGQLLIYPCLDDRQDQYTSVLRYEDAVWSARANRFMWDAYLKNAPAEQMKYLVPMRMSDLTNLPSAYVEPQEFDILCDEDIAYADALNKAGSSVELNQIRGSYHGFDGDLTSPLVQETIKIRVTVMRKMLDCSES